MYLRVIILFLVFLILVTLITQVIIPLVVNVPLFWLFKKKETLKDDLEKEVEEFVIDSKELLKKKVKLKGLTEEELKKKEELLNKVNNNLNNN